MISLGIDTGGTFTDVVLYCSENGVLAKAKSPTTREDLSIGIHHALEKSLDNRSATIAEIGLVCISTTLATNAIVEGHGGRVCLILIGMSPEAMLRSKLAEAIGSDPVVYVRGGHNAVGVETLALDENALIRAVEDYDNSVNAYAIVSHFASRNSEHELRARQLIEQHTEKPVTCSIDLSAKLDAPRRAVTAVLNARLIPLIVDLIEAVDTILRRKDINANVMIVQGDGSLLRGDQAVRAPVETILSGPAASIIGAAELVEVTDAVISDIGGTTTDIALMRDGLPQIDENGCTVAGWRTMVEAVRVFTFGLGGDSEVRIIDHKELKLGPQRAIPIGMLATSYPKIGKMLSEQLARPARQNDGILVIRYRLLPDHFKLTVREQYIWDRLESGPVLLDDLLEHAALERPLERLRRNGWVAISTLTPTDAAQFLGLHSQWNDEAINTVMALYIRRFVIDQDKPKVFAQNILDLLVEQSARHVFAAAWTAGGGDPMAVMQTGLLDRAISTDCLADNATSVSVGLTLPLIGIGAPAQTYYPLVAKRLNAESIVPEHFEVCNAIGAVVSGIRRRKEALICLVNDGVYRLHLSDIVQQSDSIDILDGLARQELTQLAIADAQANGAADITVEFRVSESSTTSNLGDKIIIERRIVAIASAAPF